MFQRGNSLTGNKFSFFFETIMMRPAQRVMTELIVDFFLGKCLLVLIHFVWISTYPPSVFLPNCFDRLHMALLYPFPLTLLSVNYIIQLLINTREVNKMILYGTIANANIYLSQTMYMSSELLPECFTLYGPAYFFLLIGIVMSFIEGRLFVSYWRDYTTNSIFSVG